jgi:hypothetical protein
MVNTTTTTDQKPLFASNIGDSGISLEGPNAYTPLAQASLPKRSTVVTEPLTADKSTIAGDTGIGLLGSDQDTQISRDNGQTAEEVAAKKEKTRQTLLEWEAPTLRDVNTLSPNRELLDTRTLAPKDQTKAFKALVRDYVVTENRLIELEERIQNAESGFLGSVRGMIARLTTANERRNLRIELTEIRTEQNEIIDQVHRRARELKYDSFVNDKSTPNLLRRAGVPEAKQNKLPEFSQLASELNEECVRRTEFGIPTQFKIDAQTAIFARTLEDGSFERIMLRHHSDGRVSFFKSNPDTDGEWKRVAVIWNDDAYKIARGFLEGKKIPQIKKAPPNEKWMLEKVKLDPLWTRHQA